MEKVTEYNQKIRSSKKMPELRSGDIVKIHRKIKERGKERTQVFEGIIIAIKGKQSSSPMVTVRRVSFGVGVELTIPVYSPAVEKIEVIKRAKTKRAKLYYLRRKDFKFSKLKMKELDQFVSEEPAEIPDQAEGEQAEDKKEAEESKENIKKESSSKTKEKKEEIEKKEE